jgi:hypothetical protein
MRVLESDMKYEYKILTFEPPATGILVPRQVEESLNGLGSSGWKVIHVTSGERGAIGFVLERQPAPEKTRGSI